ncbi:MAG: hypothetical protein WDN49_16505 [Acetobacteraceae bacterium]
MAAIDAEQPGPGADLRFDIGPVHVQGTAADDGDAAFNIDAVANQIPAKHRFVAMARPILVQVLVAEDVDRKRALAFLHRQGENHEHAAMVHADLPDRPGELQIRLMTGNRGGDLRVQAREPAIDPPHGAMDIAEDRISVHAPTLLRTPTKPPGRSDRMPRSVPI